MDACFFQWFFFTSFPTWGPLPRGRAGGAATLRPGSTPGTARHAGGPAQWSREGGAAAILWPFDRRKDGDV